MRTMPASYDCRAFKFENGQEGLFYDSVLNCLLRGKIVDFMLVAEVVHDGTDYANDKYFAAFRNGYTHFDWDLQYITWFPNDILTIDGYLNWLSTDRVTEKEIKAHFKAKRLLKETLEPQSV